MFDLVPNAALYMLWACQTCLCVRLKHSMYLPSIAGACILGKTPFPTSCQHISVSRRRRLVRTAHPPRQKYDPSTFGMGGHHLSVGWREDAISG